MSDRRWISLPLAFVALVTVGRPASACTCTGITTFDEVARKAPLVVVARIMSLGPAPSDLLGMDDPGSIELDVLWTPKGTGPSRRRVWNDMAGTSCGGAFQSKPVGTRLVVALRRVGDVRPRPQDFWDSVKFRAPDDDYLLANSGCAQPLTILETEQDVRKWVGKSIK